jgi:hypothetical protein
LSLQSNNTKCKIKWYYLLFLGITVLIILSNWFTIEDGYVVKKTVFNIKETVVNVNDNVQVKLSEKIFLSGQYVGIFNGARDFFVLKKSEGVILIEVNGISNVKHLSH